MEYLGIIISALGGGTVVALATIAFLKDKIGIIVDKRIEYHFEAKLENEKGHIEQKIYVSQHKFDKEFEIIQVLMEKAFDFTYLSWNAYITPGYSQNSEDAIKKYVIACDDYTKLYFKNCAFIPSELTISFDMFVEKINEFRSAAVKYGEELKKIGGRNYTANDENTMFQHCIEIMREIHNGINANSEYCYKKLAEVTRKHYERLEIR